MPLKINQLSCTENFQTIINLRSFELDVGLKVLLLEPFPCLIKDCLTNTFLLQLSEISDLPVENIVIAKVKFSYL